MSQEQPEPILAIGSPAYHERLRQDALREKEFAERGAEHKRQLAQSNFDTLKKYGELTGDTFLVDLKAEHIKDNKIIVSYRQGDGSINDFNLRMDELRKIFGEAASFDSQYNEGPEHRKTTTITIDLSTHMLAVHLKSALQHEIMETPGYRKKRILSFAEDLRDLTSPEKAVLLGQIADAMDANNISIKGPGFRFRLGAIGARERPTEKRRGA